MLWFCVLYRRLRVRAFYAFGFIALGVALEFVQATTPYRSFEIADMVANTVGVLFGWGIASTLRILR